MVAALGPEGFRLYPYDPLLGDWARAALAAMRAEPLDPSQMRHGQTWFVGVDALNNAPDGSIGGVPLAGAWQSDVALPRQWHRAQVSILYPGYPRQDGDESDAAHRYRIKRFAAHVDGLLPVGPKRRRFLREPHAFILGLPLNDVPAAPLMVWPGSQRIMAEAFRAALSGPEPRQVDLTEIYQAARRRVFDQIAPRPVSMLPGQAVLLHRHLLHGVAPWSAAEAPVPEGRIIAYFRPEYEVNSIDWVVNP